MALSTQFSTSIQPQYWGPDSQPEARNSGCGLANLLSQSLALYIQVEKAHWHLRLNSAAHEVNSGSDGSIEIAEDVCATSLRLISAISRLQRVLYPNLGPECASLLMAVSEKIAENRELLSGRLPDPPEQIPSTALRGRRREDQIFRDTNLPM